ncbi:hypothetical protein, partial [uncultured Chloroflexus sp.]|uniref:hypothetical protein n=1 Tax=uncultured Chloroflexus sp. TaxID=214040 RepID=UPI00260B81E2
MTDNRRQRREICPLSRRAANRAPRIFSTVALPDLRVLATVPATSLLAATRDPVTCAAVTPRG